MIKDFLRVHYNGIDKEIWLFLWHKTFLDNNWNFDPIIPGHVRFFLHFVQFLKYITNIYPYKHNLRRFIWQCFPCNVTYQINLIINSLISLFYKKREIILRFPRDPLGNLKVQLRSKRLSLEFDFETMSNVLNIWVNNIITNLIALKVNRKVT